MVNSQQQLLYVGAVGVGGYLLYRRHKATASPTITPLTTAPPASYPGMGYDGSNVLSVANVFATTQAAETAPSTSGAAQTAAANPPSTRGILKVPSVGTYFYDANQRKIPLFRQ